MYSTDNLLYEASENHKWKVIVHLPMLRDESINCVLLKASGFMIVQFYSTYLAGEMEVALKGDLSLKVT